MNDQYGTLYTTGQRYALRFERYFSVETDKVFQSITDPECFVQWYPFATGEMEFTVGGKIAFDDGEGSTYEAVITKLEPPHAFAFRELDDLLDIRLLPEGKGTRMIFTHTFNDQSMAVSTAAGWHRCLDVLGMIIAGKAPEWTDHAAELRDLYKQRFANDED